MAEINKDKIEVYAGEIKEAVRLLKECTELVREKFLQDDTLIRSTKYNFVVASQAAIDICYHIVAKKGGRSPKDYAHCFELLDELNILPKETVRKMADMAKFRNLLVHHYIKVDNERVYEKLKDIDVFLEFLGKLGETLLP